MKAKLICLLTLAAASIMPAAADDKAVVIVATDGSQRQEAIKTLDRIELGKDHLTLKNTDGKSETFEYAAIDRILVDAEWDAIKAISAEGEIAVWPAQTPGPVNITGLKEGDQITIANLKGAKVVSAKAEKGLTTISLANQPAGVYIVSAANHSVKIIKK